MKKISNNINEFKSIVISFLDRLEKKDIATIVALSGDLGSGKTSFVKFVGEYFHVIEDITSPTFVIQKEYYIPHHHSFKKMIHIDAYRLKDKSELEYLGWNEIVKDAENIIFIEWPEQVSGIYMKDALNINIKIIDDDSREINFLS